MAVQCTMPDDRYRYPNTLLLNDKHDACDIVIYMSSLPLAVQQTAVILNCLPQISRLVGM